MRLSIQLNSFRFFWRFLTSYLRHRRSPLPDRYSCLAEAILPAREALGKDWSISAQCLIEDIRRAFRTPAQKNRAFRTLDSVTYQLRSPTMREAGAISFASRLYLGNCESVIATIDVEVWQFGDDESGLRWWNSVYPSLVQKGFLTRSPTMVEDNRDEACPVFHQLIPPFYLKIVFVNSVEFADAVLALLNDAIRKCGESLASNETPPL